MLRILTLTTLFLCTCFSEELRLWTTDDGNTFPATFKGIRKDTVTLTNEKGKDAKFSTKKLGVADRFYLHTEHNVPIEDLEGGNIFNAEEKVRLSLRDLEKIKPLKLEGEGYKLNLSGYLGPNLLLLYQRGLDVEEHIIAIQRALFSHSYRHLDHQKRLAGGKKLVFLFIEDDELYDDLGKAYIAEKRAEGTMSELDINQLEQDWSTFRGHRPWELPAEYRELYKTQRHVNLEILDEEKQKSEIHLAGFYNRRWHHNWSHAQRIHARTPGGGSQVIEDPAENSIGYSLKFAQVLNNDLRTHGESTHRFGGGVDQSDVLYTGRYGETDVWAKELADDIKKGGLEPDFNLFYNAPKNYPPTTQKEYDQYGKLLLGAGRFMEHDLKHMFGVCRLNEYMYKNTKCPPTEELPQILGYESMEALNAAFKEFLVNKNRRMKP